MEAILSKPFQAPMVTPGPRTFRFLDLTAEVRHIAYGNCLSRPLPASARSDPTPGMAATTWYSQRSNCNLHCWLPPSSFVKRLSSTWTKHLRRHSLTQSNPPLQTTSLLLRIFQPLRTLSPAQLLLSIAKGTRRSALHKRHTLPNTSLRLFRSSTRSPNDTSKQQIVSCK